MSKITGKDGKAYYGAGPTEIKITSWNIKRILGLKETSDSGSVSGKDFIPDGLYEFVGGFEGFIEGGTAPPTFGTEMNLKLSLNASVYWQGQGIITEEVETLQVSGGDAVKLSAPFKGTGAWARTDTT